MLVLEGVDDAPQIAFKYGNGTHAINLQRLFLAVRACVRLQRTTAVFAKGRHNFLNRRATCGTKPIRIRATADETARRKEEIQKRLADGLRCALKVRNHDTPRLSECQFDVVAHRRLSSRDGAYRHFENIFGAQNEWAELHGANVWHHMSDAPQGI
jgi:hypothetical protein